MQIVTQILTACRPLVGFTALLFAILASLKGLAEIVPVLNQLLPIAIKGDAQRLAVIAGALALVGGAR